MNRISQYYSELKYMITQQYKHYRTTKILKLYETQKYDAILNQLPSWKSYSNFELNGHKLLFFLISENNTGFIERLLQKKYKDNILNDDSNQNSFFPLTFSVINGLPQISDLLIANGANINKLHKEGNNIVHICAFYNRLEAIKYAQQKGMTLNTQNDRGDTALHLAALKGHTEIVDYLLANKGQFDIENVEHHLPIHEAVLFGQFEAYMKLKPYFQGIRRNSQQPHIVHYAAMLENQYILNNLIEDNLALLNFKDSKSNATPLHYSVNSDSIECTSYLLGKGALVDPQDKFGNTPLHLAVEAKLLGQCQELCNHGADPAIQNIDKLSPLDLAIVDSDKSILTYFKSVPRFSNLFRG